MSTPRARRCFAVACVGCGSFRTCKWRGWPGNSWLIPPYQTDQDILQRALGGFEIGEAAPGRAEIGEQAGDAGALAPGVVVIGQVAALVRQFEMVGGKRRRDGIDARLQMQLELLPAELLHQV